MTYSKKYFSCMAGIVLACLLAVGTVSAYEADPACASLMELLNGTPRLKSVELIHTHTDTTYGTLKISVGYSIPPEEGIRNELHSLIETDGEGGHHLKWITLTTVSGTRRISYILSPDTSRFERLPLPVKWPGITPEPGVAQEIDRIAQSHFSKPGSNALISHITHNRGENMSSIAGTYTNGSALNYFSNRSSLRSTLPVTGRFIRTLPPRPSFNISRP